MTTNQKPSAAEVDRALQIARRMGYVSVNDQERALINLLRYTTYHGRNLVMETAIAMRCAHPWRDSIDNRNTHSLHPAGDPRFATLSNPTPC